MTSVLSFPLEALILSFQLIFYLFLNNTTSKFIAVPGLHFAPFFLIAEEKVKENGFRKKANR
jgi:hypothetical protein